MKKRNLLPVLLSAAAIILGTVAAQGKEEDKNLRGTIATKEEQKGADEYFDSLFGSDKLPFSFSIGDRHYDSFTEDFTVRHGKNGIEALHTSGIKVSVVWEQEFRYAEFGWQVSFENESDTDSPVLSSVNAIDLRYSGTSPCLNYSMGDVVDDPYIYAAFDTPLPAGAAMEFDPGCGKSTGHEKPYYRLTAEEGGVILALGWQGRWKMRFASVSGNDGMTDVSIAGGQYEFSSFLKPGEKVITPSVTLIKFNGNDKCRQINMWRRWFYDCAAIRNSDGELFGSQISYGPSMSVTPDQTESNMIAQLKNYNASHRNTLYWIDAGWYPIYGNLSLPITNTYWRYTGTWRVDTNRFPTKFAEVKKNFADGVKLMLWFEPERVVAGTELSEMPELLLTGGDGINSLLNMGDPAAVRLISEKVVGIMKETGCDIYRQDFNIDPYEFWKSADLRQGSNRNGMTENLYVQGLADYYITLLRYTDNPIDMCASGGMRNDMSVMRFSINMTVSDTSAEKLTIHQNIRLCYNEWFSMFYGPGSSDPYAGASTLSYITSAAGSDVWDRIDHLMLGDYYPLTGVSTGEDSWCAYEFFDPRYDEGFAVFIRRPESGESTLRQKLYGLDPDTKYMVTELYTGKNTVKSGKELSETGLGVWLAEGSAAVYKISTGGK